MLYIVKVVTLLNGVNIIFDGFLRGGYDELAGLVIGSIVGLLFSPVAVAPKRGRVLGQVGYVLVRCSPASMPC